MQGRLPGSQGFSGKATEEAERPRAGTTRELPLANCLRPSASAVRGARPHSRRLVGWALSTSSRVRHVAAATISLSWLSLRSESAPGACQGPKVSQAQVLSLQCWCPARPGPTGASLQVLGPEGPGACLFVPLPACWRTGRYALRLASSSTSTEARGARGLQVCKPGPELIINLLRWLTRRTGHCSICQRASDVIDTVAARLRSLSHLRPAGCW